MRKAILLVILLIALFPHNASAKVLASMNGDDWAKMVQSCNSKIQALEDAANALFTKGNNVATAVLKYKQRVLNAGPGTAQAVDGHLDRYKMKRRELSQAIKNYKKCVKRIKLTENVDWD